MRKHGNPPIWRKTAGTLLGAALAVTMAGPVLSVQLPGSEVQAEESTKSTAEDTDVTAQTGESAAQGTSSLQETYGLESDVQDGVILHAWDWSFNNIKTHMKDIAAAGYSAIQTSPVQPYKQAADAGNGTNATWYLFYQPTDFAVTQSSKDNLLGSENEFRAMCDEADRYGIKIIVDVVANHVAATRTGGSGIDESVASCLQNEAFYHNMSFPAIDYSNRTSIINNSMGSAPNTLPDLNTENHELQTYILDFLKDCINDGADGFRFDAAKHIGVPADGSEYDFWPNVVTAAKTYYAGKDNTTADSLYCYGEILDNPGGNTTASDYTDYVSVTDNSTSAAIRNGVTGGNAAKAALSEYYKNVPASKVVLWAESHDEYQNEGGATTGTDIAAIDKTWALAASRADATALYYARTDGYRAGNIGDIGTDDWENPEVTAVNDFHNYFAGTAEYLSSDGSFAMNERGSQGTVIVNVSGSSADVSIKVHAMANGTYTDQITGNTFTVADGTIKGTMGDTGVAVVYDPQASLDPGVTISKQGGTFYDDTLALTIGLSNASYGTYCINNGDAVKFTGTTDITIGQNIAYDTDIALTLTAYGENKTVSMTYTFSKTSWVDNIAYLKVPDGWNTDTLYCYIYSSSDGEYSSWPGEKMTYNEALGLYETTLPKGFLNAGVIFNDGDGGHQDPLYNKGFFEFNTNGKWIYENGIWHTYTGEQTENYSVCFDNSVTNWDSVYAYMWADNGSNNGAWPGVSMKLASAKKNIYSIDIDTKDGFSHIIFTNGNGTQTDNQTLPGFNSLFTKGQNGGWEEFTEDSTANTWYFKNTSNWAQVYAYAWVNGGSASNHSWPGVTMSVYDADRGIYKITLDGTAGFDRIIFNNNDGKQTADLELPSGTSIYTPAASDSWEAYTLPKEEPVYHIYNQYGTDYIVDDDGSFADGFVTVDGTKYYAKDGGKVVKDDFVTVKGDDGSSKTYYMDSDGHITTGFMLRWNYFKYYFDDNGVMQTGLFTAEEDGNTYTYYAGEDGVLVRGDFADAATEDEKTVTNYFDDNGRRVTGSMEKWSFYYYFDDNGTMAENAFVSLDGVTYYFGEDGKRVYYWNTIDGNKYFFGEDGAMRTGTVDIWYHTYVFGEDGKLLEE